VVTGRLESTPGPVAVLRNVWLRLYVDIPESGAPARTSAGGPQRSRRSQNLRPAW
jgi:hypothetical protein